MKKILSLLLGLNLLFITPAMSQDEDFMKSTQNDILIVAGSGVAGAILGLSTLSFVDKPSKHLPNIWTGAAIGVIVGVVWVAYNSAQKGQEDLLSEAPSKDFKTAERAQWHSEKNALLSFQPVQFGTQIWQMNF